MVSIVTIDRIVSHSDYFVYLTFILPAILGYITTSICYQTAFRYNRFPEWVIIPWISFTGVGNPESWIFLFGFTSAGIAVLLVHYIFTSKIMTNTNIINISNLKNVMCINKIPYFDKFVYFIMRWTLISSAMGIIIQSWINVDNQWLIDFLSPKFQTMQWFTSWNATIHIGFAAILFFHNTFYYNLAVLLTFNYKGNIWLKLSYCFKLLMFVLELMSAVVCFWGFIIFSYFVDPYQHTSLFHIGLNIIGLCQYVSTATYCLFAASYAWDYYFVNKSKTCKKNQ